MQTGFLIAAVPYALIGLVGWRTHRSFQQREAAVVQPTPPASVSAPSLSVPSEVEAVLPPAAFVPGKTPFAAETLPAQAVLQDVLRTLDAQAARSRTRLTVAVAPGLVLRADPAALGQALRDIVGGAIHRSPHGQVLVCAALHGGRVQVGVTDEGAGTGEAALAGLSEITRAIVALHGGTLEARHQDGGATVVLRLPAPPRERLAAPVRPEAAPVGAARPAAAPTRGPAITTG